MNMNNSSYMLARIVVLALAALLSAQPSGAQTQTIGWCKFDTRTYQFEGTDKEQAKCLLRHVRIGAQPGPDLTELPQVLDTIIGTDIGFEKSTLQSYFDQNGIADGEIGGALTDPLSTTLDNPVDAYPARYFVIHDTSTPHCGKEGNCAVCGEFPPNMDSVSWRFNDPDGRLLLKYSDGSAIAHLFIGRAGHSILGHDFKKPWRGTKLESNDNLGVSSRGRFLHVELVQPRLHRRTTSRGNKCYPRTTNLNDLIAPEPGFTTAQYRRLAEAYIAASARAGSWLIPAFHANIDRGFRGAHDDPQNFSLDAWSSEIADVLEVVSADGSTGTTLEAGDLEINLETIQSRDMDCGANGCVIGCTVQARFSNNTSSVVDYLAVSFDHTETRSPEASDATLVVGRYSLANGQSATATGHTIQSDCSGVDFDFPGVSCRLEDGTSCRSSVKLTTASTTEPAAIVRSQIPAISCETADRSVRLRRSTGLITIALPETGRLFGEGHYVTASDSFPGNRNYPAPMDPQPFNSGPVQCNEHIQRHMEHSLKLYRELDPEATIARLYPDRWADKWTPQEGGECGQGSIGDTQLRHLTPQKEMWFLTMNWASGRDRPAIDTRFLISANGRHVVAIAGYETGPGGDHMLGGVTREVHGWLGTDNNSQITVSYLADQAAHIGPVTCSN